MTYKLIDYERLKTFSEGLKTKYATKNDLPKNLSDLQEDATHRLVTDSEKKNWNDKVSQSQITEDDNDSSDNKVFSARTVNQKFDDYAIQFANSLSNISKEVKNKTQRLEGELSEVNDAFSLVALKEELPTKISELENDTTFKTESEIQSMIEKASSLKKEVVTSLPTTGKDDVIYLVQDPKGKENNNYLEYLWLTGKYELIGSTQVDLTGYATLSDIDTNTNILNKERDKATASDVAKKTGAGKYVDGNLLAEIKVDIYSEILTWISTNMKAPDIQEFTQQELEEAFK